MAPATDRDILWSMDTHETDSLYQLLNTVLFTLRLSYALCAGRAHSCEALLFIVNFLAMWVMMVFHYVKDTEDQKTKTNNRGSLKHRKLVTKVVNIHPIPGTDSCPIQMGHRSITVKEYNKMSDWQRKIARSCVTGKIFSNNCSLLTCYCYKLVSFIHIVCLV